MASGWFVRANGLKSAKRMLEQLSIDFEGDVVYVAGPTTEYAIYHELGTSKMAARPFMRPAMEDVEANTGHWVRRMASSQGITLDSEEAVVRCAALAVVHLGQQIAREKDVRDTGATIASIRAERVS